MEWLELIGHSGCIRPSPPPAGTPRAGCPAPHLGASREFQGGDLTALGCCTPVLHRSAPGAPGNLLCSRLCPVPLVLALGTTGIQDP